MLLFLLSAFCAQAQVKTFTGKQALQDLELLKSSMEEGNPSLFRYTSRKQWEESISLLRKQLDTGMNALDFYLLLARTVSAIGDGHTKMVLPGNYLSYLNFESSTTIPLGLKFMNDKIYIRYNYSLDKNIKEGAEILSVNDIPAATLIKELRSYVASDNNITGFKNRRLDLEYRELLSLKFHLPAFYRLRIRNTDKKHTMPLSSHQG